MSIRTISTWAGTTITVLTVAMAGGIAAADNARYSKQKVVYHINYDNPKAQTAALRNIQNHINAVGAENLDLKVVMHGHGVSLVLLPEALAKVSDKMKHANATDQMAARIDGNETAAQALLTRLSSAQAMVIKR